MTTSQPILSYFETFPTVQSFPNPLNLSLLLLIIFLMFQLFPSSPTIPLSEKLPTTSKNEEYNWRPKHHLASSTIVWRKWTPKELRRFDGTKDETTSQGEGEGGGKILFAIRRKVYDLTNNGGKAFYGPGGAYSTFAGRDASRGLAKQSFEEDMLTSVEEPIDPLDDLTKAEWENLRDWESHFQNKYILCGDYVEP